MTRKVMNQTRCKSCGEKIYCSHCGVAHYPGTEYSDWLRKRGSPLSSINFSNHNLDYIWHNYRQNWLITQEEKRHGAQSSNSQKSTHGIIRQLLEHSSGKKVKDFITGQIVEFEYRGHYEIIFSHTNPDDSVWISINGIKTNKGKLIKLLSSGRLD